MNQFAKWSACAVIAATTFAATPALAQDAGAAKNVISANPFGLLLELFNAEYERVISESSTVGVGGSYYGAGDSTYNELGEATGVEDYANADVFYRFYPSGNPLNGWAFGAKVGVTKVVDQGTYFGYGFDVNRSWLLGKNNNFYVGLGFGLKKLVGTKEEDFDLEYIPTFRIINVGWAF